MFRAKLIENKRYYKLRVKQMSLMFLLLIPGSIVLFVYKTPPIWIAIPALVLYIGTIILMVRNQKKICSVAGNKLIEMDIDEIRIKSKKGIEEKIKLNNIEKIILKDQYSMPQETMKEVGQELTGKIKQNYIIINQDNEARRFDFEFDSYYMINQLNNLIKSWQTKEYNIEKIS